MCGRYALALRPSQVRRMLEDDGLPVYDAPPDGYESDEASGGGGGEEDNTHHARRAAGPAPRQSYNFAPGYFGIVYRADTPDWGAGPARTHGKKATTARDDKGQGAERAEEEQQATSRDEDTATGEADGHTTQPHYMLQAMKWGLVPFWTKRRPDYASTLKTINCRDDSLAQPGGMWSTMKARKRCVVVAQGFYEWLKPGGPGSREKIPHFVKRADGKLMCFAGLWDCVRYDDDGADDDGADGKKSSRGADADAATRGGGGGGGLYTYTIVTTDSNEQLRFLHDRMPVILDQCADGGAAIRTWLDPGRSEWSRELQALLRPFRGRLEVYPVSKEVGKVGNNSPRFVVPVASRENKGNIANFFAHATSPSKGKKGTGSSDRKGTVSPTDKERDLEQVEVKEEEEEQEKKKEPGERGTTTTLKSVDRAAEAADDGGMLSSPPRPVKREQVSPAASPRPAQKARVRTPSPAPQTEPRPGRRNAQTSATSNRPKAAQRTPGRKASSRKGDDASSQKITKFFGNSA